MVPTPSSFTDFLWYMLQLSDSSRSEHYLTVLWSIWFHQNFLSWKNVVTQPDRIVCFADILLQDWPKATAVVVTVADWLRPPAGCLTCNMDAVISWIGR